MNKAIFLDRDGVINYPIIRYGKPYPPENISQLKVMPGVAEGLDLLKSAGYLLIVVTNQPDVGRGSKSIETVEAIHQDLLIKLPIDEIKVAYDAGRDEPQSGRRKPAPGMLMEAARERGVSLGKSWMLGDRWRDIDCGAAAGCMTIFFDYGYKEILRKKPDYTVSLFQEAVEIIINKTN